MKGFRPFAIVVLGLLLSAAPSVPGCGAMGSMSCCAGDMSASEMTHGADTHGCVKHANTPSTMSKECCDMRPRPESDRAATVERGATQTRIALAEVHAVEPDLQSNRRSGVPPTVFSRSHDPGLFTLFASFLL